MKGEENVTMMSACDFFGVKEDRPSKSMEHLKKKTQNSSAEKEPTTPLDWAYHLLDHPEEEDRCDFAGWRGLEWGLLLNRHPEFASKCDFGALAGEDWRHLLIVSEHFEDKCEEKGGWSLLSGDDWVVLLLYRPELANFCDWSKAKLAEPMLVAELLAARPEFAANYDLSLFDGWCTGFLLSRQPQFAEKCDLSKLDRRQWLSLIGWQPEFAAKCDREKLGIAEKDWEVALNGVPPHQDVFTLGVNVYEAL